MSPLCNCDLCHCTRPSGGSGRKAAPCLFCATGDEHGVALKAPNRYRICRSPECRERRAYTIGMGAWPEECPTCGSSFGPVTLGLDWVSEGEAEAPGWPTLSRVSGQRQAAFTRLLTAARKGKA